MSTDVQAEFKNRVVEAKKGINVVRVVFTLRKMKIRNITPETIESVVTILAVHSLGMRDITSRLFSYLMGI